MDSFSSERKDVIGRSKGRKDRNCFDIQKGKNDAIKCTVHVSKIKLSEGGSKYSEGIESLPQI